MYRKIHCNSAVPVAVLVALLIWTPTASAQTTVAVNGNSASGRISSGGSDTWFAFQATSGGSYTIETRLGTLADSVITLYGPGSRTTWIDENDDISSSNRASRIVRSLQAGTYYVRVRAYSRRQTGTFSLSVSRPVTSSPPPGPSPSSTPPAGMDVSVNGPGVSGSITSNGQVDTYRFSTASRGDVVIQTSLGTLSDSYIYLYDAASTGSSLAEDDDGGGGLASRIARTLNAGTYLVRVRAYASSQRGTYTLRVTGTSVPPAVTSPTPSPLSGPSITQLGFDAAAAGTISPASDEDWFSFNAVAGGRYVIDVNLGTLGDSMLYLYQTDRIREIAHNDDYNGSLRSHLDQTLAVGGAYYLKVVSYAASGEGTYTIVCHETRPQAPPAAPPGVQVTIRELRIPAAEHGQYASAIDSVSSTFDASSDEIWYHFTPEQGRTYVFQVPPDDPVPGSGTMPIPVVGIGLSLFGAAPVNQGAPLQRGGRSAVSDPPEPIIKWHCDEAGREWYLKVTRAHSWLGQRRSFRLAAWEYYPIVFVHGIISDATTWNTTMGQLRARGWRRWQDSVDGVSDAGWESRPTFAAISFPGRGRGVIPTEALTGQSLRLTFYLSGFRRACASAELGDPQVVLVAHSNGGLVCRRYLQDPLYRQNPPAGSSDGAGVRTLLTYGSPHRGCPLLVDFQTNAYRLLGGDPLDLAVRDSRDQSVFLQGGWESYDADSRPVLRSAFPRAVWGSWLTDVNGNGRVDYVSGLNLLATRRGNGPPPPASFVRLTPLPDSVWYIWQRSRLDGVVPFDRQAPLPRSSDFPGGCPDSRSSLPQSTFMLHWDETRNYDTIFDDLGVPR